jgi:hypothetical protein
MQANDLTLGEQKNSWVSPEIEPRVSTGAIQAGYLYIIILNRLQRIPE